MELAYGLYMAEAEGFLNTKTGKINALIKDLKGIKNQGLNPNDYLLELLEINNLTLEELTEEEARFIERSVDG